MGSATRQRWNAIEEWSPWLFVVAGVFLVVGAANSGVAFVSESYAFDEWLGIVLELGRVAALLGTAGLSVQVATENARLGTLNRAVASLGVVFVSALIAQATLESAGVIAESGGLVGLAAYVLSVTTFLAVGIGVLWTGAYSRLIGGLLLVNVVALLVVFFGRRFVPLGLLATVVPGIQVLLYLSLGYELRGQTVPTRQPAPETDATP